MKINFGILDVEMTCDGRQEGNKFIDNGRMKRSEREIISVGFIVVDNNYNIQRKYKSFVKPAHCTKLTEYCKNLTGIKQSDVDCGKKCNDAFFDIMKICAKYRAEIILTFGNADKAGIYSSAKFCKKAKEQVHSLYSVSSKIVDVRPIIIELLKLKKHKKNIGLFKIAELLKLKCNVKKHNAFNDVMILRKICNKLKLS